MRRFKRSIVISLACALMVSAVVALVLAALAPTWVEKSVAHFLESDAGIEGFEWQVRRIGFTGADFGGIKLGEKQPYALSAASVQIDYDLRGLLNWRLEQVRISGVDIFFELENGKLSFPGIDTEKLLKRGEGADRDSGKSGGPPVFVERVVFENAVLNGVFENNRFTIPLDLVLFSGDEDYANVRAVAELFPSGQRIGIDSLLERNEERLKVSFDTTGFRLGSFFGLFVPVSSLDLDGTVDLKGRAAFDLSSFKIVSAEVRLESESLAGSTGAVGFGKFVREEEPFRFGIEGGGGNWKFSASGLSVRSGVVDLDIEKFDGTVRTSENSVESEFAMTSELGIPRDGGPSLEPAVRRQWKGKASLVENARWFLDVENEPADGADGKGWHRVGTADFDARIMLPPFKISGNGDLARDSASVELKISDVRMDADAFSVRLPLLECSAELSKMKSEDKTAENKGEAQGLNFSVRVSDANVRSGASNANFSGVSLAGKVPDIDAAEKRFAGTLKIKGGGATNSQYDVAARNFNLEVPVAWPPSDRGEPGTVSLASLGFDGKNLGKIAAEIRQDGFGAIIDGVFRSEFVKGLNLKFKGSVQNGGHGLMGRLDFKIDNYRFGPGFRLADLVPEAQGVFLEGKLALEGGFAITGPKMESSARIGIDHLKISVDEPSAVVQGVRMDLDIPDLLALRSLPRQRISFESASVGNIRIKDGNVFFRVESPKSIFVERTDFKWCDGNVETNAMTIGIPFEELDFTLYCDRLDLAGVLEQLGGIKGEGKGSVNGRIPIRFENSSFKFDDGFLFSTPGQGGTVRLTGTDILMAGIPADTPQFAQVDLAREALKNYDYEWARINIDTKGENLHVNLKLDGQPAGPLPFRYDREFGGFARVEAESPGSNFQGIRLDVNFTLPLDEVLKYGLGLKGALE